MNFYVNDLIFSDILHCAYKKITSFASERLLSIAWTILL